MCSKFTIENCMRKTVFIAGNALPGCSPRMATGLMNCQEAGSTPSLSSAPSDVHSSLEEFLWKNNNLRGVPGTNSNFSQRMLTACSKRSAQREVVGFIIPMKFVRAHHKPRYAISTKK